MRISVITPVFSIAGVPLAQVRFARALARRGHQVDLVIGRIDPSHPFPEARAKISCSSRVTPFDTYSNAFRSKRWVLKQFMRAVMWRANALTCVSKDMVLQYRTIFRNSPHVAVYNIVDDKRSRELMMEPVDHPWLADPQGNVLVAAGRLAPWKGFADLIRAVKLLVDRGRDVRLLILGDGPLRAELEAQISALGLGGNIQLVGYVANPLKFFSRAKVFVLSSLVEGLPNVLVEAMMCGCTPVSTNCPTGPDEVLEGGRFGYLVPVQDSEAMADAIGKALDSPTPKAMLDLAVQPFEETTVINRHFEVLGITGQGGA
jgi:glycosyltransferase involved in cell wall biosynthesis